MAMFKLCYLTQIAVIGSLFRCPTLWLCLALAHICFHFHKTKSVLIGLHLCQTSFILFLFVDKFTS